jgi:hypothetical protein
MDALKDLLKKEKMGQVLLSIVFIIYLIMGYKTPEVVANMVDNILGKTVVVIVAILLFSCCNPILGVLGLVVAYELIRRSEIKTGNHALRNYMPTEEKKASCLNAFNQFPYTLEQEMVSKMAPIQHTVSSDAPYVPILDNNYDATPISSSN